MGFAVFAYKSYRQKQKANKDLDDKNTKIQGAYKIIEEKKHHQNPPGTSVMEYYLPD